VTELAWTELYHSRDADEPIDLSLNNVIAGPRRRLRMARELISWPFIPLPLGSECRRSSFHKRRITRDSAAMLRATGECPIRTMLSPFIRVIDEHGDLPPSLRLIQHVRNACLIQFLSVNLIALCNASNQRRGRTQQL